MSYTHGHAIMNLLLLRRGRALYWLPIVLGGMFPDLMLLIFIIYQLSIGEDAQRMFDEIYFEQRWQIVFGFFHGFFTYATIILICALLLKYTGDLPLALAQNNIDGSNSSNKENRDIEVDEDIGADDAMPMAMIAADVIVGVPADNNNSDDEIKEHANEHHLSLALTEGKDKENKTSGDSKEEGRGIEIDDTSAVAANVTDVSDNNDDQIYHAMKHWSYPCLVGTIYFASSAFLHSLFDFCVHHDDGHESFVPFSIWKFQSPVSYWDINHFSYIVFPIETAAVVYSCIFIWQEHRRSKGKRACLTGTTLGIVLITYLLMFVGSVFQTLNHFSNGDNE